MPAYRLFCVIAVIICGCNVQKLNTKFSGVLISNFKVYDTALKKFSIDFNKRDPLIYFRDSLFIGERLVLNSHSTNGILDTSYYEVNYYQFGDLKTNTAMHFKTFTDTAKPIKVYIISKVDRDSTFKSPWDFYGYGKPINSESSAKILSDTVMNGINYDRILTYSINKTNDQSDTSFVIYYASCKTNYSMFQFDISLSKKFANGCPIQMADFFWSNSSIKLRLKYDFIRDTLTLKEHKVFDAWEKYAKEHPAK
jgi:hypothetical protein